MKYINFNSLVVDESYNKLTDVFVELDPTIDTISFANNNLFFDEETIDINIFCIKLFEDFIFMCDENIIKMLSKYVEEYIKKNNIKYIYNNKSILMDGFFLVDNKLAKSPLRFSKKLCYNDISKSKVTYNLSEFLTYIFYVYFNGKVVINDCKYNFIPYSDDLKTSDEFIENLKSIRNE